MSQNNLPTNLPSVERLIQRVTVAEKSQQKEIRISTDEAKMLINELAIFSSRLGIAIQDIHKMLIDLKASSNNIDIKFDGGKF
jgi:hypothetical protein